MESRLSTFGHVQELTYAKEQRSYDAAGSGCDAQDETVHGEISSHWKEGEELTHTFC
jgi:hypothetical protein